MVSRLITPSRTLGLFGRTEQCWFSSPDWTLFAPVVYVPLYPVISRRIHTHFSIAYDDGVSSRLVLLILRSDGLAQYTCLCRPVVIQVVQKLMN